MLDGSLFLMMINMSITATYIAIIIILIRGIFMRKAPKIFSYVLWSILLFRLISPFTISSSLSLMNIISPPVINNAMEYVNRDIGLMKIPKIDTGIDIINNIINPTLPAATPASSVNPMQVLLFLVSFVWMTGIVVFIIYSIISYIKVLTNVNTATLYKSTIIDDVKTKLNMKKNISVYESDKIESPFVCGFIIPKVYLPINIKANEITYILMHEFIHIKRFDYIIKIFSYLLLTIHWFNPVMWLSFNLMSKDLEMSCDEGVIINLGNDIKKDYSKSLLSLAVNNKNIINGSPLAFGESNVKSRIKNIIKFKRTSYLVVTILIILIGISGIVLATNSKGKNENFIKIEYKDEYETYETPVDTYEITNSDINYSTQQSKIGEFCSPNNDIGKVTSNSVSEIEKDMTYKEIIMKLGKTKDIGSGLYIAQYVIDDNKILSISFANIMDVCPLTGEELLKEAEDIK